MELKKGYKQTEVGVIPSDWEVKNIIDIADVDLDNLGSSTNPDYQFKYISLEDVDNGLLRNSTELIFNYAPSRARRKIKKGDILISTVRPNLKSHLHITKEVSNWICSTGFSVLRCKVESSNSGYVYSHFFSSIINRQIENLISGSNYPSINSKDVRSLLIPVPPNKSEQTAIATALSDADALIASLEKLIAKKRLIKQGAMQELLKPKKGWVVKKLGEVIHLQGGYAFRSDLFTTIGVPIIRISDVGNDKVDISNSVFYSPFNIPKDFIAKKGDVLIAMSGATTGKIGVYDEKVIAYINQRVGKFVVLNEQVTSQDFISHLVRSEKFKNSLTKEIAQGAQPNISGNQIQSIELYFPDNRSEQMEIAKMLSEMDSEISLLEVRLKKSILMKRGMMQNLLTGKIRLV